MDQMSYQSHSGSESTGHSTTFLKVSQLQNSYANTETLATAIQDNFDELVDIISGKVDDVVKVLDQQLCITEKERAEIKSMENPDQKAGYLLVLIRGRTFEILTKFLDTIQSIHGKEGELLTLDIYRDYDRMRQKKMIEYVCAYCNINEHVPLYGLAGYLWQRKQITSNTHAAILKPITKREKDLWDKLWKECQTMTKITQIQTYLEEDKLFTHLSEELDQQAKIQNYKIKCACSNAALKKRFQNVRLSMVSLNTKITQDSSVITTYTKGTESTGTYYTCPSPDYKSTSHSPSTRSYMPSCLSCLCFPSCKKGDQYRVTNTAKKE